MTDKELTELNTRLAGDPSVLALSRSGKGGPVPTAEEEAGILASANALIDAAAKRLVTENGLSYADAVLKIGTAVPLAQVVRRRTQMQLG